MFDSLFKSVLGVAILPVAMTADVVTLGGNLVDREKPFTQECAETIDENLRETVK